MADIWTADEAYGDSFRAGVAACIGVVREAEEQSKSFRHTSYAWLVDRFKKRCLESVGEEPTREKGGPDGR